MRNEILAIVDHLYVKISKLALFNIKSLLKEDNILHILNESNLNTTSDLSLNHHFVQSLVHIQLRKFGNNYMFVISNNKSFMPQILKVVSPLGKNLIYFVPRDL